MRDRSRTASPLGLDPPSGVPEAPAAATAPDEAAAVAVTGLGAASRVGAGIQETCRGLLRASARPTSVPAGGNPDWPPAVHQADADLGPARGRPNADCALWIPQGPPARPASLHVLVSTTGFGANSAAPVVGRSAA